MEIFPNRTVLLFYNNYFVILHVIITADNILVMTAVNKIHRKELGVRSKPGVCLCMCCRSHERKTFRWSARKPMSWWHSALEVMGHLPMMGEMDEVYPGRWVVQSHCLGVHEAMEMLISGACEENVLENAHFISYTNATSKAAGLGMVWLSLMSHHHVVQLEGITTCKAQPCKSPHSQGRPLLYHRHTPLQPAGRGLKYMTAKPWLQKKYFMKEQSISIYIQSKNY